MQKIEIVIFKEYFNKSFDKLENRFKETFFKKIEVLEIKDNFTKRLHFKQHLYEMRCFRIGKFRFIFIVKDNIATFLDVMYRELDYKDKYLDRLIGVYKYGN